MTDNKKKLLSVSGICCLVFTIAVMLCFTFLNVSNSNEYIKYLSKLKAGYIADEDICVISSIDIIDEEGTTEARQAAYDLVKSVFSFDSLVSYSVFDEFQKISEMSEYNSNIISISYNLIEELLQYGIFDSSELSELETITVSNSSALSNCAEYEAYVRDLISDENLTSYLKNRIDGLEYLSLREKEEVYSLVLSVVKVNVKYDALQTEKKRQEAYDSVATVVISLEKGQVIIPKDKVITQSQLELLSVLGNTGTLLSALLFQILCLHCYALSPSICFSTLLLQMMYTIQCPM